GKIDVPSGDRDEQDVNVAEPGEIGRGKHVAQIDKVADDEVIQPDREDGVPPTDRALGVVVEGPDAGHQHLVDLVFPGPAEDHRLAANRLETGMAEVLVRDRNDGGVGLGYGVAGLGVGRIRQHDAFAPAHAKTGVTEPGQVHGAGREYAKWPAGPCLSWPS